MTCGRCGAPAPRLIKAYWDGVETCPTCCEDLDLRFTQRNCWPQRGRMDV